MSAGSMSSTAASSGFTRRPESVWMNGPGSSTAVNRMTLRLPGRRGGRPAYAQLELQALVARLCRPLPERRDEQLDAAVAAVFERLVDGGQTDVGRDLDVV